MYGLSDQPNGIPRTRLSAERQGSSRYSVRKPDSIEHTFVSTGPAGGAVTIARRSAWTTTTTRRVPRQAHDPHARAAGPRGADPAERVLRRGRVRARHVAPHAHPR